MLACSTPPSQALAKSCLVPHAAPRRYTVNNVIGLKGAMGILTMLWNKIVSEVLFREGYWVCIAVGLYWGGRKMEKCLFFTCLWKMQTVAVKVAFDFSASFFPPISLLWCLEELHFNHVLLIGGMTRKGRVKEARAYCVSMQNTLHCLFFLSVTYIHQEDPLCSLQMQMVSPVFCFLLFSFDALYSLNS